MAQGIIFDFDGLIVDTELPEYQSWQEVYASYDCSLPLPEWVKLIGAGYASGRFDPYDYLEAQLGRPVDRDEVRRKRRERSAELQGSQPILPGVQSCISSAKQLGLRLGIASSSPRHWVHGHLERVGLEQQFECVKCAEDVGKTKPDPELYLSVLRALELAPGDAIALEDSPNGILAAKRAGIFCVAVPNALTSQLEFDQADLVLSSLAELSLEELLAKALAG